MTTVGISYPPVPSVLGVSPHGLLAGVGMIAGLLAVRRAGRRSGVDTTRVEAALSWGILAGIVGARLDYVVTHLDQFGSLWQVLAVWKGGLALFGGLIAGAGAVTVVLRRGAQPLLPLLDLVAPAVPLAIAVGRVGDLLLTDHLGAPTRSAWALAYRIPVGAVLAPGYGPSPAAPAPLGQSYAQVGRFYAGCSYHLTPAYDIALALLLWAFLTYLARRPHPAGALLGLLVTGYAIGRLGLDQFRAVDERLWWGLSSTQLLSIVLAGAGIAALGWLYTRHRPPPPDPVEPPPGPTPPLAVVLDMPTASRAARRERAVGAHRTPTGARR